MSAICFLEACYLGNIDEIKNTINIDQIQVNDILMGFNKACMQGHIDILKLLVSYNKFDLETIQEAFLYACNFGYIDVIQLIYKINQEFLTENILWKAFNSSAICGKLEVVNQLYEWKKDSVDFSKYDTKVFIWTCKNGYLEVAKVLYKLKPNIDHQLLSIVLHNAAINEDFEIVKQIIEWNKTLKVTKKTYPFIKNEEIKNFLKNYSEI